jgi:hypothetical protein
MSQIYARGMKDEENCMKSVIVCTIDLREIIKDKLECD